MSVNPRLLTRFSDVFYAFDKPAGMAVHNAGEGIPDLSSWIQEQSSLPRALKPGHRLDRATSGIVLCGAGGKARAQISEWIENDACKKYLALVAGVPTKPQGTLSSPLFDERRKRPLPCETLYEVRQEFNGFTLLELQLITGRRHQIRRHLAKADLPIVGDERYGPKRPKRIHGFPGRLWLHAWKLTIAEKVIEAPLPEALETHLTILNEGPSEAP